MRSCVCTHQEWMKSATSFLPSLLLLLSFLARCCAATVELIPVLRLSACPVKEDVDCNGHVWNADVMYFDDKNTRMNYSTKHIRGAKDDDALYYYTSNQLENNGLTYDIPVADLAGFSGAVQDASFLKVTLHLSDLRELQQVVDKRAMDVIAQGEIVVDELDALETAAEGRRRRRRRLLEVETFNVTTVVAGSTFNLRFQPVLGKAILSAMQASATETSTPSIAPSAGTYEPSSIPSEGQSSFPTWRVPLSATQMPSSSPSVASITRGQEPSLIPSAISTATQKPSSVPSEATQMPSPSPSISPTRRRLEPSSIPSAVFAETPTPSTVPPSPGWPMPTSDPSISPQAGMQPSPLSIPSAISDLTDKLTSSSQMPSSDDSSLTDEKQLDFPSTRPDQPFIQIVEYPARKSAGCVSLPQGAPWCPNNGPAFWWIGHDNTPERPVCQALDGSWSKETALAQLDTNDPLNDIDGPANIDRHDCAINDNNADGNPDLICVVGANKGMGNGFTEVYITQQDGSVRKILEGHGLHKYPTMRTRQIEPLVSASGAPMMMITTTGAPREDGQTNHHRMFKQVSFGPELSDIFFEEVDGPFIKENESACLVVADLNHDGIDDFISCVQNARSNIYVQNADDTWSEIDLSSVVSNQYVERWNTARVADMNGDGRNDLIVVGYKRKHTVRIFLGDASLQSTTLFNFSQPYWEQELPHDAFSLEVLDTNDDGAWDIYVTQVDMGDGTYCGDYRNWKEEEDFNLKDPGPGWSPPLDEAADVLFLGTTNMIPPATNDNLFTRVTMDHVLPGCGFHTRMWNDKGIQLANGNLGINGEHAILQW